MATAIIFWWSLAMEVETKTRKRGLPCGGLRGGFGERGRCRRGSAARGGRAWREGEEGGGGKEGGR